MTPESCVALFERFAGARKEPEGLMTLRREAIARFSELGFPTQKLEDWKYTGLKPVVEHAFELAPESQALPAVRQLAERVIFKEALKSHVVFIDGVYSKELSTLPRVGPGAGVGSLWNALRIEPERVLKHLGRYGLCGADAFTALNTAFYRDGAFIYLPAGTSLEELVQIVYISLASSPGTMTQPRTLVVAEDESRARLVETYVTLGDGPSLTNAVTEIYLGPGAGVVHYRVQEESLTGYHIGSTHVWQGADSTFSSFSVATGALLAKTSTRVILGEEHSGARLMGLYLAHGGQHLDNQTFISHAKPHTTSRQLYKGILDGNSTAVFNGKIIVEREAQKTDALQKNKTLLLSDRASCDTRPQLEIFADDVKCAHGAAVGELDAQALFYLKSRGMGDDSARGLLTEGFAHEVIDDILIEGLKARVSSMLRQKFFNGGRARHGEVDG